MTAARGAGTGRQDAQNAALLASTDTKRPRKYRNTPTTVDGVRFDSKKEAARYAELVRLERAGAIDHLGIHPRFPLVVHDQDCGYYEADFSYRDRTTGEIVIEDVKSAATRKLPVYRLKRRLMWAIYGINIVEV